MRIGENYAVGLLYVQVDHQILTEAVLSAIGNKILKYKDCFDIMNIIVRRDFNTINEAVSAAQRGDNIIIPSGVYPEKVTVDKEDLSFTGDGFVTITYDAASGKLTQSGGIYDTFSSATLTVTEAAANFRADNITFENNYNRIDSARPLTQAVAVSCGADYASFENCNFLGCQDTLYVHSGGMFFHDCYIEGSVDFIFGNAQALFEDCDINCVRSGSYITAANTSEKSDTGLVFYHCYISANEGCSDIYLGRPWRAEKDGINSAAAFIECTYNFDCTPEGWHPWNLQPGTEQENTRYFEYKNEDLHGRRADISGRAPWSRQLSRSEAESIMRIAGRYAKYSE